MSETSDSGRDHAGNSVGGWAGQFEQGRKRAPPGAEQALRSLGRVGVGLLGSTLVPQCLTGREVRSSQPQIRPGFVVPPRCL